MENSAPEERSPNHFRNSLFWWVCGLSMFGVVTAYRTRGLDPPYAPLGLLFSVFAAAVFCLRGALRLWKPLTEEEYQPYPFPIADRILSWIIVILLAASLAVGVAILCDTWYRPSFELMVAALLSFPLPIFAYVAWKRIKEATANV